MKWREFLLALSDWHDRWIRFFVPLADMPHWQVRGWEFTSRDVATCLGMSLEHAATDLRRAYKMGNLCRRKVHLKGDREWHYEYWLSRRGHYFICHGQQSANEIEDEEYLESSGERFRQRMLEQRQQRESPMLETELLAFDSNGKIELDGTGNPLYRKIRYPPSMAARIEQQRMLEFLLARVVGMQE